LHVLPCFPGRRFGHLTSNISESINSWLNDAHEEPIGPMLESIKTHLMQWFDEQRQLEGMHARRNRGCRYTVMAEMRKSMPFVHRCDCDRGTWGRGAREHNGPQTKTHPRTSLLIRRIRRRILYHIIYSSASALIVFAPPASLYPRSSSAMLVGFLTSLYLRVALPS
jgi:hypothetical protein